MSCDCFLCSHKDDIKSSIAYLKGYSDAIRPFIKWATSKDVKPDSLGKDTIGSIFAEMSLNYEDAQCILGDLEEKESSSKD